jgi:hypothetical protein
MVSICLPSNLDITEQNKYMWQSKQVTIQNPPKTWEKKLKEFETLWCNVTKTIEIEWRKTGEKLKINF